MSLSWPKWFFQKKNVNKKIIAGAVGTVVVSGILLPVVTEIIRSPLNKIRCYLQPSLEECLPSSITIQLEGSTSMVGVTDQLATGLQKKIPNTKVIVKTTSSNDAIDKLKDEKIDIAAVSRELTEDEKNRGLVAEFVANEPIAVVVDNDNYLRNITLSQLKKIFQCDLNDWSKIDHRQSRPIKVINRFSKSGTYDEFKKIVLKGEEFCDTAESPLSDETTGLLHQLSNGGITYASYGQVYKQQTVHVLLVNNKWPTERDYPLTRKLYYVYRAEDQKQANIQRFLEYTKSDKGKAEIKRAFPYVRN